MNGVSAPLSTVIPDVQHDKAEAKRRQDLAKLSQEQAELAETMRAKQQAVEALVHLRKEQEKERLVAHRDAILRIQMQQAAAASESQQGRATLASVGAAKEAHTVTTSGEDGAVMEKMDSTQFDAEAEVQP